MCGMRPSMAVCLGPCDVMRCDAMGWDGECCDVM